MVGRLSLIVSQNRYSLGIGGSSPGLRPVTNGQKEQTRFLRTKSKALLSAKTLLRNRKASEGVKESKDSRQSRRSADEKLVALAGRNNTPNRSLKALKDAPTLESNKLNRTLEDASKRPTASQAIPDNDLLTPTSDFTDGDAVLNLQLENLLNELEGEAPPPSLKANLSSSNETSSTPSPSQTSTDSASAKLTPEDDLDLELERYLDALEGNQFSGYSDSKPDLLPVHLSSLEQKSPKSSPNRTFIDGTPNRARSKAPKPLPKPKSSSLNRRPDFSNASSPNRPQSSSPSPSALRK